MLTTGATTANFTALAAARQWWGDQQGVDVAAHGLSRRYDALGEHGRIPSRVRQLANDDRNADLMLETVRELGRRLVD